MMGFVPAHSPVVVVGIAVYAWLAGCRRLSERASGRASGRTELTLSQPVRSVDRDETVVCGEKT